MCYILWNNNQICIIIIIITESFKRVAQIHLLTKLKASRTSTLGDAVLPLSLREALHCHSSGLQLQEAEQQAHPRRQQRAHGGAEEGGADWWGGGSVDDQNVQTV